MKGKFAETSLDRGGYRIFIREGLQVLGGAVLLAEGAPAREGAPSSESACGWGHLPFTVYVRMLPKRGIDVFTVVPSNRTFLPRIVSEK